MDKNRDLRIWHKAIVFATEVYNATLIIRNSDGEFCNFPVISNGSHYSQLK